MKKILYILSLFLLSQISVLQAQNTSANVNVTAEVVTSLNATVQQHMNFGTVVQGSTNTINPETDTNEHGVIQLTGSDQLDIIVTFPTSVTMEDSGTGTMDATSITVRSHTANDPSLSTLEAGTPFTLTGSGIYYLYIGGTLVVPSNQTVGSYNGTATITMDYDN